MKGKDFERLNKDPKRPINCPTNYSETKNKVDAEAPRITIQCEHLKTN